MPKFDADAAPPSEAAGTAAGPSSARERWQCLECDYSLAFTTEDRCPECGAAFSAVVHRAILDGTPLPSYPWDEAQTVGNWLRTAWIALFQPLEFRRRMSAFPDRDAALAFLRVTLVAQAAVLAAAVMGAALLNAEFPTGVGRLPLDVLFMICLAWPIYSMLAEFMLVLFAASTLRPRGCRLPLDAWHTLVHYHSVFGLVLALLAGSMLVAAQLLGLKLADDSPRARAALQIAQTPVFGVFGLVLLIWWVRLVGHAIALSRPTWRSAFGVFVVGAIAFCIGLLHAGCSGVVYFAAAPVLCPEFAD